MQTYMSRGPLAEDEPSKKGTVGGRPSAAPTVPFAHPPPFPLHFCLNLRMVNLKTDKMGPVNMGPFRKSIRNSERTEVLTDPI